jgi:hypothetical protein
VSPVESGGLFLVTVLRKSTRNERGEKMQENLVPTKRDLFNACSVLFGTNVNVSVDFLKYLQASGLKEAYRKKAFETHPDRASLLAESSLSLEERFKEVNLAYEKLITFIESPRKYSLRDHTLRRTAEPHATGRKQRIHEAQTQRRSGNTGHQSSSRGLSENYWQGQLPGKKLLFGRFLYYRGIISMRSLIEAIVWQKGQRPMIGSIAIHWDWLAKNDLYTVLARRKPGEKFCECALRCGYINPYQLNVLLWRQRMLQPRIGSFFVNRNIVTPREIEHNIAQLRAHNIKYWRT